MNTYVCDGCGTRMGDKGPVLEGELRTALEKIRAQIIDAGAGPLGWSLTLASVSCIVDDALRASPIESRTPAR